MPIDITMPQLSPTMTEGRLAGWLKKEGDRIAAGDIIAEVETDKATMEVEATDDGVLHKILEQPGNDIQVGAPIAIMAADGEKVAADYKPTSTAKPMAEEAAPEAPTQETSQSEPVPTPAPQPVAAPMPAAAASPAPAVASNANGTRTKASPLAKRLAAQLGVSLSNIVGSGPHGRVVKKDVENAPTFGGGARDIVRKGDVAEKLSPMRKAIAGRLTASKQHVPHFYLTADVRMDAVLEARKQLNTYADGQVKLTVNDFILKASAAALAKYPAANAAWGGDQLITYGNVDIAVAVAIDGGLITPILTNADQKGIVQLSKEMKDLAAQAKAGKLKPEQYEGGSFSVSNLGMYGVKEFSAIINPPQAAILACGASNVQPVVGEDGQLTSASVMSMTLSVDHRVIDGALGAELLASIKQHLEQPVTLLL